MKSVVALGLYESQMRTCGVCGEALVDGQRIALMHNIVQRDARFGAPPMACRAFNPVGLLYHARARPDGVRLSIGRYAGGEGVPQITIFA
jgi:hypothetical protein